MAGSVRDGMGVVAQLADMAENATRFYVACVAVLVLIAGTAAVTDAQQNMSTATPTSTPTPTAEPSGSGDVLKIDDAVTVESYRVDDGELSITFRSNVAGRLVTIIENRQCSGACKPDQKTTSLTKGRTTVRFGHTDVSIWSGRTLVILDADGGISLFSDNWQTRDVYMTGATGLASGFLLVFIIALRRRHDDGDPEPERWL